MSLPTVLRVGDLNPFQKLSPLLSCDICRNLFRRSIFLSLHPPLFPSILQLFHLIFNVILSQFEADDGVDVTSTRHNLGITNCFNSTILCCFFCWNCANVKVFWHLTNSQIPLSHKICGVSGRNPLFAKLEKIFSFVADCWKPFIIAAHLFNQFNLYGPKNFLWTSNALTDTYSFE